MDRQHGPQLDDLYDSQNKAVITQAHFIRPVPRLDQCPFQAHSSQNVRRESQTSLETVDLEVLAAFGIEVGVTQRLEAMRGRCTLLFVFAAASLNGLYIRHLRYNDLGDPCHQDYLCTLLPTGATNR